MARERKWDEGRTWTNAPHMAMYQTGAIIELYDLNHSGKRHWEPRLVLVVNGDGTVIFEPVWLQRQQAVADWQTLIEKLELPYPLGDILAHRSLLPTWVTSPPFQNQHLRDICGGAQHVSGIGPKQRMLIRQAAERLGILQPEPSQ